MIYRVLKVSEVFNAWYRLLTGLLPDLSTLETGLPITFTAGQTRNLSRFYSALSVISVLCCSKYYAPIVGIAYIIMLILCPEESNYSKQNRIIGRPLLSFNVFNCHSEMVAHVVGAMSCSPAY